MSRVPIAIGRHPSERRRPLREVVVLALTLLESLWSQALLVEDAKRNDLDGCAYPTRMTIVPLLPLQLQSLLQPLVVQTLRGSPLLQRLSQPRRKTKHQQSRLRVRIAELAAAIGRTRRLLGYSSTYLALKASLAVPSPTKTPSYRIAILKRYVHCSNVYIVYSLT